MDSALAPVGVAVAITAGETSYAFLLVLPLVGLLSLFAREHRTQIDRTLELSHAYRGTAYLLGDIIEVGRLVRSCHERYDGSGYPDGLTGEDIPLVARIVRCCDAFHAMTSDRAYRKALSQDAALAELEANSGAQFDPEVVAALTAVVGGESTCSR
jgi:hypothetical protein